MHILKNKYEVKGHLKQININIEQKDIIYWLSYQLNFKWIN